MFAYSLTGMTGRKKNANRSVIFLTAELNRRTAWVGGVSIVAGLLLAGLVTALMVIAGLGQYALIAFVLPIMTLGIGLFLFNQQTKKGLQLYRWRALVDSRQGKAKADVLYVCGVPMEKPSLGHVIPQYIDSAPETVAAAIGTNVRTRGERVNFLA